MRKMFLMLLFSILMFMTSCGQKELKPTGVLVVNPESLSEEEPIKQEYLETTGISLNYTIFSENINTLDNKRKIYLKAFIDEKDMKNAKDEEFEKYIKYITNEYISENEFCNSISIDLYKKNDDYDKQCTIGRGSFLETENSVNHDYNNFIFNFEIAKEPNSKQEIIEAPIIENAETLSEKIKSGQEEIKPEQEKTKYILNKSTKKVHMPNCKSAKKIIEKNYDTTEDLQGAFDSGYSKCKICSPQ